VDTESSDEDEDVGFEGCSVDNTSLTEPYGLGAAYGDAPYAGGAYPVISAATSLFALLDLTPTQ
jgi:hypothetical protein